MADFPQEILTEILHRLPSKTLIRFTTVSKSWRNIITDPSFISLHHRHSPRLLLLQLCDEGSFPNRSSAIVNYSLSLDDNPPFLSFNSSSLLLPPNSFPREFSVIGICDGLVCLTTGNYCDFLVICNPSLRRYVTLPMPQSFNSLYAAAVGFSFDSRSKDYKVVRISCLLDDRRYGRTVPNVEVYSLSTGFWRTLHCAVPVCSLVCVGRDAPHAFVNGVVHWGAKRREGDEWFRFVLSFDFADEVFSVLLLPESLSRGKEDSLTVIGGGVGLTVYFVSDGLSYSCEIWVMKEYGVVESWNKVFTFSLRGYILESLAFGISMPNVTTPPVVLCIRKSGEVLLLVDEAGKGTLHSLDIERKRFTNIGIGGEGYTWYLYTSYYAESLVLLNKASSMVPY